MYLIFKERAVHPQIPLDRLVCAQVEEAEHAQPKGGHHKNHAVRGVLAHNLGLVEARRRVAREAAAVDVEQHRAATNGTLH